VRASTLRVRLLGLLFSGLVLGTACSQSEGRKREDALRRQGSGAVLQERDREALRRFAKLSPELQKRALDRVARRLQLDPDTHIQAIFELAPRPAQVPIAKPAPVHDPAEWAKGVARKRKKIDSRNGLHRSLRNQVPPVAFVPELHQAVWYDWQRGELARKPEGLSRTERFENLLNGFVPGSDAAMAEFQRLCDRDFEMRRYAAYFGHLYADLGARYYEGITLYEVWFSDAKLDVPDVDAIPFAKRILRDDSFVSPIPAGARRAGLYEKIKAGALRMRKYRTLREAAAAAFVAASAQIAPGYEALIPRFHLVLGLNGNDPERVARVLEGIGSREELLRLLDDLILKGPDEQKQAAYRKREERIASMRQLAAKVRQLALHALEEAERN
jgi:hypothetical protein